eukprot:CAMPEP_0197459026 /NCGR_PEP_ID=MMETSP1175-20131217/50222_1 /TAXON_ID=1003142 /ORGANISM="Triceratium dubium, Strain CCMP147" /LENGTH=172 /DNA_ID=CAMNT_0042993793 /DNA_START=205 /DNA_END=723 /DNA_ORIENTATION=-
MASEMQMLPFAARKLMDSRESGIKGAGCDCSKDDMSDILQTQKVIVPSLIVIVNQLNENDNIMGRVLNSIHDCINLAIQVLTQFKCGGCVDNVSGITSVLTYDCCCDSDKIKDMVKDTVTAIAAAINYFFIQDGLLDTGLLEIMIDDYKMSLELGIEGIIDDYDDINLPADD